MADDCEIIYSQSNLESLKADYEKQMSFVQKQLEEARAYCAKKDQTISDLQLQLEKMNLLCDDKKDEIAKLAKQQKELDQQKSSTVKTEKELKNAFVEITALQDKNFSLSQENKKFIELIAAQKKEFEKSNELVRKLQAEIGQLKNELNKKGNQKEQNNKPNMSNNNNNIKEKEREEALLLIKKNLQGVHESTKRLCEDLESRIEVIKFTEVDKKSEDLRKAYERDLVEIRDKLKEIMFFKDIAEGALL